MQRASYLFLFMQSNSRSVSNAKNLPPSTFPLNPEKRPFFRIFCDDKRIVRRRKKEERREGKFYLCKVVTVFGRCAAISFSCLVCRIWWEAIIWNHSRRFRVPRKGWGM